MLDILLLKDATAPFKEVEWKRALEIEYEALLANGTYISTSTNRKLIV